MSHSEIRGSRDICSLPRLIAAYPVLHRLCEPRHPPCALTYFISPTPASTMLFTSHPQSVITLILSAVFFRSKKSGNCILYLAIEYFSVSRSLMAEGLQTALYSLACVKMSKILWQRTLVRAGVENNGFEPLTPCLQSRCSSQLS